MSFGERLALFRESLDPELGPVPVGRRTLDRIYDAANRWQKLEGAEAPSQLGAESLDSVLARLDATQEAKDAARAFVLRGEGALPWERVAWKKGESPVRIMGGPRGPRRKPAGEVITLPPLSYEVQVLALLRANREGELDDVETVASIYTLGRSYYNKTERSGDAVA